MTLEESEKIRPGNHEARRWLQCLGRRGIRTRFVHGDGAGGPARPEDVENQVAAVRRVFVDLHAPADNDNEEVRRLALREERVATLVVTQLRDCDEALTIFGADSAEQWDSGEDRRSRTWHRAILKQSLLELDRLRKQHVILEVDVRLEVGV